MCEPPGWVRMVCTVSRAPYHLVVAALAACSADPGSSKPASPDPMDSVRARCHAMEGDSKACMDDRSCVTGPPRKSCSGGNGAKVCTQGGPITCMPCRDMVALVGRPTVEYCDLRSAGQDREACLVLDRDEPKRCD